MATNIHPTAIVSSKAVLGDRVTIGPYCIVEDDVVLGDGCSLSGHVVIKSGVSMGCDNEVSYGSVLGGKPQHAKIDKEFGGLSIGNGNKIRENVTIHAAMERGRNTIVGNGNLLMVNSHLGHDVVMGNHTIVVNNVMLGGHSIIGDRAVLGGAAGVHQFCRVGQYAMVGGQAHIVQDVPPYVTVDGATTRVCGLNRIGLRRNGFTDDQMLDLKHAYRIMYRSGLTWTEVIDLLSKQFTTGPASLLAPFLSVGRRGFVQERRTPRTATLRIPDHIDNEEGERNLRRVG